MCPHPPIVQQLALPPASRSTAQTFIEASCEISVHPRAAACSAGDPLREQRARGRRDASSPGGDEEAPVRSSIPGKTGRRRRGEEEEERKRGGERERPNAHVNMH
ncbi:unnamed protein product [Pleuronectes platessa]|uniref:Uncharacterized protein n=1 Tax=Pleuronectes platessa TaxID=8262 RepID=A0A9N7VC94_PLEPL|nr:unnamed protein product [Pleuronectes platessa]